MISSNKEFYHQAIQEFGISAQGVHWNSKFTQYKRFEILTKLIKKEIKSSSIIDVGCGFGEYYNYLQNNKKVPSLYIGIDCEEDMINISRKRFPSLDFFQQNILTDKLIEADYYVCSGALNILNFAQIKKFIFNCFQSAHKAFVFNYLKNDTFRNITKEQIVHICQEICDKVTIKEGYLDNDFTIIMIK